jgi:diaminopimelate decarboxylase
MNGRLLTAIASTVGTPVFVYDAARIRTRYAALTGALGTRFPFRVHYSVKANSNLAVLGLLRSLGAGADIVSAGELQRVLVAGFAPGDIVFSGVGKTEAELGEAVTRGVGLVNVESEAEAERLVALARTRGWRARVGIRVNPDVTADTHPYTRTGTKGDKFGVPFDTVVPLARRLAAEPAVELTAIGMHIGSQITAPAPYRAGAERLAELVCAVRAAGVESLAAVDVGGGMGIAYEDGDASLDPDAFAEAVAPVHGATGLPLLVEPGRFLVGAAGVLLTRVTYRKRAGGRDIAVVDAGMNDLLRPSLYQAVHPIRVVAPTGTGEEEVDVVGPICETGDFLGRRRRLVGAGPGALLAISGAGAYAFSMSSQYNSRPRAAEVLVDGDRWGIIREREGVQDLMQGEHLIPCWADDA